MAWHSHILPPSRVISKWSPTWRTKRETERERENNNKRNRKRKRNETWWKNQNLIDNGTLVRWREEEDGDFVDGAPPLLQMKELNGRLIEWSLNNCFNCLARRGTVLAPYSPSWCFVTAFCPFCCPCCSAAAFAALLLLPCCCPAAALLAAALLLPCCCPAAALLTQIND